MSTFTISHDLLLKVCTINQFILPTLEMLFVGLRGAIVSNASDQSFKEQQLLAVKDINCVNPRCTILQWRRADGHLAAFPASTVPNQINVKKALAGGDNANCLLTGFYQDYRKGVHKPTSVTGHEAFRQNAPHPCQRTIDDLDFDKDDRIEFDNPHDNIHCGWFQSLASTNFASAGCQVIMGFPKCEKPGRENNVGPWKTFHDNSYSLSQTSFPFIASELLLIHSVKKVKLRFGSSGNHVMKLQQALKDRSLYEGNIDGDFGQRTLKSLILFQQMKFGNQDADCIVGPITAEELGIDLSL